MVDEAEELPELFSHLAAIVMEVAHEHGLEEPMATAAGWAVVQRFKADFRGQQVYVPKGHMAELAARNAAIYEAWRLGVRADVLARRHGIALQHVYTIVNREKARPENQMKGLFDDLRP